MSTNKSLLLIFGYIRRTLVDKNKIYPVDIAKEIEKIYSKILLIDYDPKLISVEEDGKTLQAINGTKAHTAFYGRWINSTSKQIIKHAIQIHIDYNQTIWFGIVSSKGDQAYNKYI